MSRAHQQQPTAGIYIRDVHMRHRFLFPLCLISVKLPTLLQAQAAAGDVEAQQGLLSTLGDLGLDAFPAARKAKVLAAGTAEPSARVVLALACLCRYVGHALVGMCLL